jgi:hypothetical protein
MIFSGCKYGTVSGAGELILSKNKIALEIYDCQYMTFKYLYIITFSDSFRTRLHATWVALKFILS